jgi:2-polyprenylphenol 6-hydroxylase
MPIAAHYDVVVVGGGIVGLTAALALAKKTSLSIALVAAETETPTWSQADYHARVSAITLTSKRIFQALGVWQEIAKKRLSPFTHIRVWNSGHATEHLQFASSEINQAVLGYIIENNVMQESLLAECRLCSNLKIIAEKIVQFDEVHLVAANQQVLHAKLVVAADGANSWLREAAGILVNQYNYAEAAIVATITSEFPHESIARQCFLSGGPLGILPLAQPHLSSIVWSQSRENAERLLALPEDQFKNELMLAADNTLGEILQISQRHIFPLKKLHTLAYVKSRVVLVGDAAHVVHPLAGQGVNMGLLDVACLLDVITAAIKADKDFAATKTLRRYERWRKADNSLMLTGIDLIKRTCANEKSFLTQCSTLGFLGLNHLPLIKNIFTSYATGSRSNLPTMCM